VSNLLDWFLGHHDLVSIAGAGALFATVGVLFNLVHTFRERLARSRAETAKLITRTADVAVRELTEARYALLHSWVDDLQRLLPVIAQPEVPIIDATNAAADFVRSRLVELTLALQGSNEAVRASVWLMSDTDQQLHFVLGSDTTGPRASFRAGEGIVGRAYIENTIWNIRDRKERPEYAKPEPTEPFRGLLCIPLTTGSLTIGVMCIDQTNAEEFPDSSVKLASALTRLITLALMNPRHEKALAENTKEPPK
jgi:GAF domain-containing protein